MKDIFKKIILVISVSLLWALAGIFSLYVVFPTVPILDILKISLTQFINMILSLTFFIWLYERFIIKKKEVKI